MASRARHEIIAIVVYGESTTEVAADVETGPVVDRRGRRRVRGWRGAWHARSAEAVAR